MRSLCENCLALTAVAAFPIGNDRGSQRDPWRETLTLCEPCRTALEGHDLFGFAQRYQAERQHVVTTEDAVDRPEPETGARLSCGCWKRVVAGTSIGYDVRCSTHGDVVVRVLAVNVPEDA